MARYALAPGDRPWSVVKALEKLPAGGARHLPATVAEYEGRLVSLRTAEPKLSGALARSVADAFAPMGAKMRPDMSPEQAGFWTAALVKAFSDLPPFIVKAALEEAIHIPFEFPTQMEVKVREIAERKLADHKRAIARLRAMIAEIQRMAHPPQAVLEAPEPDRPWSPEELAKMPEGIRRMGLAGGWLTQSELDEADQQFREARE